MSTLFSFFTGSSRRSFGIACCWTLLILIACFIPGDDVPQVKLPFIDKWVHIFIFSGCSFFWRCALVRTKYKGGRVFFGSVLLGCLVELVQGSGLVRHRSPEINDILADALGAFLGIVLFGFMKKYGSGFTQRRKKV